MFAKILLPCPSGTKHLSGMGPVNLVTDGHGKGTFPYYP
jgi:hypothetical protein